MNQLALVNQTKTKKQKPGPKVTSAISSLLPEELLNSLADLVIERIQEESIKGGISAQLANKESVQV